MRPDAPFVVFALPRSRTFWLAQFLSVGGWYCGHDEARHFRGLDDVKSWLAQPNTGSVETAAAPYWRLLKKLAPDARVVIIRRPVEDVVESLMRIDLRGTGAFDRDALAASMRRHDAKLRQIAKRWPGVLVVDFDELATEAGARAVWEHCLPIPFDAQRWRAMNAVNLQCDFPALMRYAGAYRAQVEKMADVAAHTMRVDLMARRGVELEGVTLAEEDFATWRRDGISLFEEHAVQVGEGPDAHKGKNEALLSRLHDLGNLQIVTARSNGRMFGYLVTVLSPSLESPDIKTAVHTVFFGSPEFPGLGMKLQRYALDRLKSRGVDEVFFRAGPRGSGPRMAAMFRRLGATDDGQLYRLNLRA